jgi:hypothetical protein
MWRRAYRCTHQSRPGGPREQNHSHGPMGSDAGGRRGRREPGRSPGRLARASINRAVGRADVRQRAPWWADWGDVCTVAARAVDDITYWYSTRAATSDGDRHGGPPAGRRAGSLGVGHRGPSPPRHRSPGRRDRAGRASLGGRSPGPRAGGSDDPRPASRPTSRARPHHDGGGSSMSAVVPSHARSTAAHSRADAGSMPKCSSGCQNRKASSRSSGLDRRTQRL